MTKLLSSLLLAGAVFSSTSSGYNHRPYISTNLAKAIITYSVDDTISEQCDGSGWITHGDGHKTECPGCTACQNSEPKPETQSSTRCDPTTTRPIRKLLFWRR